MISLKSKNRSHSRAEPHKNQSSGLKMALEHSPRDLPSGLPLTPLAQTLDMCFSLSCYNNYTLLNEYILRGSMCYPMVTVCHLQSSFISSHTWLWLSMSPSVFCMMLLLQFSISCRFLPRTIVVISMTKSNWISPSFKAGSDIEDH